MFDIFPEYCRATQSWVLLEWDCEVGRQTALGYFWSITFTQTVKVRELCLFIRHSLFLKVICMSKKKSLKKHLEGIVRGSMAGALREVNRKLPGSLAEALPSTVETLAVYKPGCLRRQHGLWHQIDSSFPQFQLWLPHTQTGWLTLKKLLKATASSVKQGIILTSASLSSLISMK